MADNIGKKRDQSLDIVKGICIILMVLGHAGCPEWLNQYMAWFRMPCFFFISGILLSERYLTDIKSGILKKLKGYYLPFLKWELIFILLHNLFANMHIYETSYTWNEVGIRMLRAVVMSGGEQLLGGYWFLISLTWASIGSILFLGFLQKCKKLTTVYISGGVLAAVFIASIEYLLPVKLPAQFGPQTFLAFAFFMSGFLYRKCGFYTKKLSSAFILPLLFPAIVSIFLKMSMTTATGIYSCVYFIVALSGTIGFLQFAKKLEYGELKLFNYIGNKTLYILTFHFLAFKPVSYLWIKAHHLPISYLSKFPVLEDTNSWMWVIYTLAGTALPLLLWELLHLPVWNFKGIRK